MAYLILAEFQLSLEHNPDDGLEERWGGQGSLVVPVTLASIFR